MNEIMIFFEQHWQSFLSTILAFVVGFLSSYIKERVKNRALLADIKQLEEEKQLVRKEHQLDIEKRKYKYESKREQFTKYFNLIDSFATKSNDDIKSQFLPIITTYNQEFLGADGDKEKETNAVTKFSDEINRLMLNVNQDLIRLRSETNGIKIIADSRTIELINTMDDLYDISFDLTSKLIEELNPAVLTNDFSGVQKTELEIQEVANQLIATKNLIIEQIRTELDEI